MQIELNAETRWILGRPNFACGKLAERLRELGHDVGPSAELEQAAVIHWMLNLYLEHGAEWMEEAEAILAPSVVSHRKCIILRGLPGSGKSCIAFSIIQQDPEAQVFSADRFFLNENGEYVFDREKLPAAHAKTQADFSEAIAAGVATVVVDNTNTTAAEMLPYVSRAVQHGYAVEFRTPATEWAWNVGECARRNTHGVPLAAVERMNSRFQHNLTVEEILAEKPTEAAANA